MLFQAEISGFSGIYPFRKAVLTIKGGFHLMRWDAKCSEWYRRVFVTLAGVSPSASVSDADAFEAAIVFR